MYDYCDHCGDEADVLVQVFIRDKGIELWCCACICKEGKVTLD